MARHTGAAWLIHPHLTGANAEVCHRCNNYDSTTELCELTYFAQGQYMTTATCVERVKLCVWCRYDAMHDNVYVEILDYA